MSEDNKTATKQTGLTTKEDGSFDLRTIEAKTHLATRLLKEKMISNTFKTPQQVVIAIEFARALSIEPIVALKHMYVVNGRPSLYGNGPLILIQMSPKFKSINEYYVDDKMEKICLENKNINKAAYAAVCEVERHGDPVKQVDYFTVVDMAKAQLNSPVWKKYERIMLRYRARAMALQTKFADLLNGVEIAEHHSETIIMDGQTITEKKTEDINERFGPKVVEAEVVE